MKVALSYRRYLASATIALVLLATLLTSVSGSTRVATQGRPGEADPGPPRANVQVAPQDKTGTQWYPYLEWTLVNTSFSGNPFDLIATATFRHTASGETRTTEMFYDGSDAWRFRFTATRTGEWTFTTASTDLDLDGYAGTATISPNPEPNAHGFMKNFGQKWGWQGTETAFVPQLVMYNDDPKKYYNNPTLIDSHIQEFFGTHGFNGFHTGVIGGWWFDFDRADNRVNSAMTDPDLRTFEALELLIAQTHAAGGSVHIRAWGDDSRAQTPRGLASGLNGLEDQRLQRYIAARLGPIPGWSTGYGYDLGEWVSASQVKTWRDYMHSKMGPNHFLGGRPSGPRSGTDHSAFIGWNTPLDYSSYEHNRPPYDVYVAALQAIPGQPVLSEDRFRVRNQGRPKDYDMEDTRRGLWRSTMAGGVANIWGNLLSGSSTLSDPYPNPEWIKTYAVFFQDRFVKELVRNNSLTDGVALKTPTGERYLFYKENTSSIQMDLSAMSGSQSAVAVDASKAYAEIGLGTLTATGQTWTAPYASDWAIAVGTFGGGSVTDDTRPSGVTGLVPTPASESQIDLSWTGASDPESGIASYNVYRSGQDGTSGIIGSTGGLSFSDTGLTEGTTYTYQVAAVNGAGLEGAKSASVSATTLADTVAPIIVSVTASGDPTKAVVKFSEPVDQASATNAANYSIDNGIIVSSASLGADLTTVTLTTSDHAEGTTYTLTVNNVMDLANSPNALAPNTQSSYSFFAVLVISNLSVDSGAAYQVVENGLNSGAKVYIDRFYTFTTVPNSLAGKSYIMTANDDRASAVTAFLSFSVNQDVTVYVAYDIRATSLPNWLSGWTDTNQILATEDVDRKLYAKVYPAGTVTLGGNKAVGAFGAQSNYNVLLVASATGAPVNQSPAANLIASPTSGAAPLTVNFDGTGSSDSDGAIVSYSWDFGDGASGAGVTAAHQYNAAGTYVVSLTVTDDAGASGISSATVTVIQYPTLPGMQGPARDLDGDGLAEDLNGNGRIDFADVVALFEHMDSPEVQNNQAYFDFDGSGQVNAGDVVRIFEMVLS